MSIDHTFISNREYYEPIKEENEKEENSESMNSELIDDEGYQTPTSEEHKIPAVVLSCPPPAPRKRKRLVLMRPSDLQKRLVDRNTIVVTEEDLDFLFQSLVGESRVLPRAAGAKKRCVDE